MRKPMLIDKLLIKRFPPSELNVHLRNLAKAEMFMIDNVEHYVQSTKMNKVIDIDSLPNIAPPFKTFFCAVEKPLVEDRPGLRWGVLFNTYNLTNAFFWNDDLREWLDHSNTTPEQAVKDGAKWIYVAVPFFETTARGIVGPEFAYYLLVHESGRALHTKMYTVANIEAMRKFLKGREHQLDEYYEARHEMSFSMVYTSLLAISFSHCKNVIIKTEEQAPKEIRRRERETGKPAIRFKTLHIEPITKILRTQGNIEQNGLPMALHICRGHFKDYRDGSGLFGKHKDIYWWEDHTRGDAEFGTILKDYSIDRTS